ncbi:hypothetical protein JMJ35_002756 [Cladonia borealis]|uniref:Uncharacterized protein n=1 Tax=Cladonia borealis TaxID=184061 RepID=A0AA39R5N6_9LECA|nr:hypothetical protein JMJ35_002756 [Cladonia borealis]
MDHINALKKVLALSALAYAVQAQNYLPYIDGQCTKPVTNFTINGNVEDVTSSFSLEGFPAAARFSNPGFGGAESQDGSGYDVWWKTSPVDVGCGQALMQAYSQGSYGDLAFNAPAGNVIMFSNGEGCIYSHIPLGVELEGSFCCGTGDCGALSVGDASFAKRDTSTIGSLLQSWVPTARSESAAGHAAAAGSITRKLARQGNFDASKCTTTVGPSGPGYPSAGQQVLVANPQQCSAGTCSFSTSHGVTVSTSFTSSSTTTITNTVGASLSIEVGVDFIAEAKVTTSAEYSWAKAVAQSTSTTITNSTTLTVTNNIGQQPGTNAFVTFTPTYTCWGVTVTCGPKDQGEFNFCQPALTSDGTGVEGDYTVVYTN